MTGLVPSKSRAGALHIAVLLVAFATLMAEVLLIRVFDVILLQNIGYMVVTCAMFGFALAGVVATLLPRPEGSDTRRHIGRISIFFAFSLLLLRPALNATPHAYERISDETMRHLVGVGLMYLALLVPFFLSGLVFAYLFSAFPSRARSLYFFDLIGAGLGCAMWVPFIRRLGPGGLLFWAASLLLLAAALLYGRGRLRGAILAGAAACAILPLVSGNDYFHFRGHKDKRGVVTAHKTGRIEVSEWDPISKIDVIGGNESKHVAYDGGSQSSHFIPFDGDYVSLRRSLLEGQDKALAQFWTPAVALSHYLKRDRDAEVLIFGSAAGQETKAALLFEPARVDGIELVGTVVRLGRETYSGYIGNIFNDPRVQNRAGEGRNFLRSSGRTYDVVQIFSNHTSSNIAVGHGSSGPNYLQTVEAYQEYFHHLKPEGILQINHHFYTRMVTTAARAWRDLGRTDFSRHVIAWEKKVGNDTLPTLLIKMSPWTAEEVSEAVEFFESTGESKRSIMVINPLDPAASLLPEAFFSGDPPKGLLDRVGYQLTPSTDDRPFFNRIQKGLSRGPDETEGSIFVDRSMMMSIRARSASFAGEYTLFVVVAAIGLGFGSLLVCGPLVFSSQGRVAWSSKAVSLSYFACLGTGFILIELTLVQLFMKLVGSPVYAYATVISTVLIAAGAGSFLSEAINIEPQNSRWFVPFTGILATGLVFWVAYPWLVNLALPAPMPVRVATTVALILPLGLFMGMPLPQGILFLQSQPRGAIAWAWGMNGLFTVLGGVGAGVLSILFGFRRTFLLALGIYVLAFWLFRSLRRQGGSSVLPSAKMISKGSPPQSIPTTFEL